MDHSVAVVNFAALKRQPVRVWLPQVLLLAYLAVVLVAFIALPVLAFNWFSVPYPGLLTGPGLLIYEAPGASTAAQHDLRPGDRLTHINGTPLQSAADLTAALRALKPGDSPIFTALRPDGQTVDVPLPLNARMPQAQQLGFIYAPFLVALVYLGSAVWTFAVRRARTVRTHADALHRLDGGRPGRPAGPLHHPGADRLVGAGARPGSAALLSTWPSSSRAKIRSFTAIPPCTWPVSFPACCWPCSPARAC